jgi:hypothetical protein
MIINISNKRCESLKSQCSRNVGFMTFSQNFDQLSFIIVSSSNEAGENVILLLRIHKTRNLFYSLMCTSVSLNRSFKTALSALEIVLVIS